MRERVQKHSLSIIAVDTCRLRDAHARKTGSNLFIHRVRHGRTKEICVRYLLFVILWAVASLAGAATGSLSWNTHAPGLPNSCLLSGTASNCTVTFNWTSNAPSATLWFYNLDTGTSAGVFSGMNNASLPISWVGTQRLQFKLHEGTSSSSAVLATSAVIRAVRPAGDLTWNTYNPANPNRCIVPTGQFHCRVTFSWTATNAPQVSLWARNVNTGVEGIIAQLPSGSSTHVDWNDATVPHVFVLRAGSTVTSDALETSPVIMGTPYVPPAPAASITVNTSSGTPTTTCTLNQQKGSCSVYVTWSSANAPNATLWYRIVEANVQEPLDDHTSGSMKLIPWIGRSSYRFEVRNGNSANSPIIAQSGIITAVEAGAATVDPGYQVGVTYHATSTNFVGDAFVLRYHEPAVRATVQSQLQTMANQGVHRVSTRLWMIRETANQGIDEAWRLAFPLSQQELANLQQYATDVANTSAPGKPRMRLDLIILWSSGAADYTKRTATTVGGANLPTAAFVARGHAAYRTVIDAVKTINISGTSTRVVETVYLEGELMCGEGLDHGNWFVNTFYTSFVAYANAAGITPSVYFITNPPYEQALRNSVMRSLTTDWYYPEVNSHISMYYFYRCARYLKDNNLFIPPRLDASVYPGVMSNAGFIPLVDRVLDDADALFTPLGINTDYGFAETFYFDQSARRSALGTALKLNASNRRGTRLKRVWLWTGPYGYNEGYYEGGHVAIPASVSEYLP